MMHARRLALFAVALALLANAGAFAQSFNVDIDFPIVDPGQGAGAPSDAFGAAANQPGFWNAFNGSTVSTPVPLDDLAGNATGVTLTLTTNTGAASPLGFNNPTNSGDYALLMNDSVQVGSIQAGGWHEYTFTGLADGTYQVFTYAAPPSGGPGIAAVNVFGSTDPGQVVTGGANNNMFIQGDTHAIHNITVTEGAITVRIDIPPNALHPTHVNGIQLVIPSPGALMLIAGAILHPRRRRRPTDTIRC